jgi:hypothetical protein
LGTLATKGVTATAIFVGPAVVVMVAVADPDFVESFWETAVIVICAGVGTVAGAVYSPVLEIVPFPLPPETLQVTPWFDVSITVAVICCVVPTTTFTPLGKTLTEIVRPAVPFLHPARINATAKGSSEQARFIRSPNAGAYLYSSSGFFATIHDNKVCYLKGNAPLAKQLRGMSLVGAPHCFALSFGGCAPNAQADRGTH